MYIYTVEAMRGQKAKTDGDSSLKYQVKRVNDAIEKSKKGRSEIIRDNLDYDEAIRLAEGFNNMEGKSQNKKDEAAQQSDNL
jgi:hypothetical protein